MITPKDTQQNRQKLLPVPEFEKNQSARCIRSILNFAGLSIHLHRFLDEGAVNIPIIPAMNKLEELQKPRPRKNSILDLARRRMPVDSCRICDNCK